MLETKDFLQYFPIYWFFRPRLLTIFIWHSMSLRCVWFVQHILDRTAHSLYTGWLFLLIFVLESLKGKSGQKTSCTQMKEREKCKTMSHRWPQCAKWFSRYHILKSAIWARWTSPFCRFLASFSLENDVTDAILQNNEKMRVQYLRSLLIDLLEILQAFRT